MHNRTVTEDPSVLDEAGDQAELERDRIVAITERGAEVLDHLVVRRLDAPSEELIGATMLEVAA